jgi:hypothetical protein
MYGLLTYSYMYRRHDEGNGHFKRLVQTRLKMHLLLVTLHCEIFSMARITMRQRTVHEGMEIFIGRKGPVLKMCVLEATDCSMS